MKIQTRRHDEEGVAGRGSTFGQTFAAYQDLSTTNDPGGRMVQIVVRINF